VAAVPDTPLTIEPPAQRWREVLRPFPNLTPEQRRFREQLGLPTDRPVILSGHQAGFWHPGILAKYFAASAASRAVGAVGGWIVVDQDVNEFALLRAPMRRPDGGLTPGACWLSPIAPGSAGADRGRVPARCEPLRAADRFEPGTPAIATIEPARIAISRALQRHESAGTAARQLTGAIGELIANFAPPLTTLYATELSRTSLFAGLRESMTGDPARCVASYNAAVARVPGVRLRALARDERHTELPLWRITSDGKRLPVFADALPALGSAEVAPRALLMTGLLRLAGCDLFIHGTGGGGSDQQAGYDRVTELWLAEWLGATLAPSATVTATLRLPIEPGAQRAAHPVLAEIESARAMAHRARHNPALVGDMSLAQRKADLVAQIREDKAAGRSTGAKYRQMHALLENYRALHHEKLAALSEKARTLAAGHSEAMILADRTWPFPLYPDGMLHDLKARIDAAFGVGSPR
jgi:hypothetical protein